MEDPTAADLNLLRYLNAVRLKEEEVSRALTAAKKACRNGETNEIAGIMIVARLFDNAPDKAKAIIFRLQALAKLIANLEFEDWVLGNECFVPAFAQEALISAAVDHPLSMVDGDISFEKKSFLRRAFELADSPGRE
jgi:hypothetical protein